MRSTIWNKRFPTLFGVGILVTVLGITTYVVTTQQTQTEQKASISTQPQNVTVSNITDSSFTVSYSTIQATVGSLIEGNSPTSLVQVILDERDQPTGKQIPYSTHEFTIHTLKPNSTYYYAVLSGATTYKNGDNPYSITTGGTLGSPSSQPPMSGKAINTQGGPASGVLVYVTSNTTQLLSTLTKNDGSYIIPLNTLRSKDNNSYATLSASDKLSIRVTDGSLLTTAILSLTQTNPVPTLTLSQVYDFTQSAEPLPTSAGQSVFSFPTTAPFVVPNTKLPQIVSPAKDNQNFVDPQPDFKGTAQPNDTVTIEIHSTAGITVQIPTDKYGNWDYRPSTPLGPGTHTITVIAKDAFGISHSTTRTFQVFVEGSQVAEAATPSATPTTALPKSTPTPTPTSIITPTGTLSASPTVTLSITPTATASVTATPTLLPTATTLPVNTVSPTAAPLPKSGSNSVLVAGIAGSAIMIVGILLFLLTRGSMSHL